jgi:N-formylglutamate amidohydrolase
MEKLEQIAAFMTLFPMLIFIPVHALCAESHLVFFQKGNSPILLTAPHAGKPENVIRGIPLRSEKGDKGFETRWDANTDLVTKLTARILEKEFNLIPYVVIAEFSRKNIDANRDPGTAFDTPLARPYYEKYHESIRQYVGEIRKAHGNGILIDIHGQGTKKDVLWRGTRSGLTIKNLIQTHGWDAVMGENGILGALKSSGYKIYPEQTDQSEAPYEGGYTVFTYGSHSADGIDALQIEIGGQFRLKESACEPFSKDLASAIHKFYSTYLKKK